MNGTLQPSPEALAGLHDSAYRWALACCAFDQERAREVLQMTYAEILSGRARFDGRSTDKTWLFAVVRRTAWREAAGSRRSAALRDRFERLGPRAAVADAADSLARQDTRDAVRVALGTLPPRQRQLVELVYYHDLSLTEAARVLGIGVGSARQHFHRAKRALAGALAPLQEALGDV